MDLDAIDIRILRELQADASLSNVELARRVSLSPSPCLARVKAMQAAGLIRRYVALLDPKQLGFISTSSSRSASSSKAARRSKASRRACARATKSWSAT